MTLAPEPIWAGVLHLETRPGGCIMSWRKDRKDDHSSEGSSCGRDDMATLPLGLPARAHCPGPALL